MCLKCFSNSKYGLFIAFNLFIRACFQPFYILRKAHTGADPGFFPRGGSGGTQTHCHRDAAGVSGEGTEGGLGGLPQAKFRI